MQQQWIITERKLYDDNPHYTNQFSRKLVPIKISEGWGQSPCLVFQGPGFTPQHNKKEKRKESAHQHFTVMTQTPKTQ